MENRTSTSSAFTAGPWHICRSEVEEVYGGSEHFAIQTDLTKGAGQIIADIEGDLDPEAEANARLIAAAPELLEALKDVTASLEDFYAVDHRAAGEHFGMALLECMRDVIAEAEGA